MGIRADDIYIHVGIADADFAQAVTDATAKHKANSPRTLLSVAPNVAGTEAVIKVRGGKDWLPDWIGGTVVKRVYKASEHDQVQILMRTVEWQPSEIVK